MRSVPKILRRLLVLVAGAWLAASSAYADVELQKALVGRWEGEIAPRQSRAAVPVVLIIKSLKEEGGKWTAEALAGRTPVSVEISTAGKQPSLRWTGANGTQYEVNLMDEKTMVGTATITTQTAGSRGDRDRSVKLEKK